MRGDMLAIKTIPHFTRESIEEYSRKVGIRSGDIVLFEDASGGGPQTANLLIEREIRAVIADTPLSHLSRETLIDAVIPVIEASSVELQMIADTPLSHLSRETLIDAVIPVIEASSVELQRIDEFAFISRKKFENQFQDFMAETKEKARQRSEDHLVDLVEEYRADSRE
jgi:predicted RNase H-like nuclease (RuvC/YqgF family)